MDNRWSPFFLTLPLVVLASTVLAQSPAPPAPAQDFNGSPLYDPAQLPGFEGKVQQFTLTPRGEIDGLILTDGTEVKTPPHLSTAIAYAIRTGDAVTIHGLRAAAIPLVQATSISDHTTNRSVVDQGSGPGPRAPASIGNPAGMAEVGGVIRMSLHGARGEINGALLTDGTVLRLRPDVAATMPEVLQRGRAVVARGDELTSPVGKVLEVRAIGTTRGNLAPIDAAPAFGPRGRPRPPLPGPEVPPPPPAG